MVDFKRYERKTGLDKRTLERLYREAEDVAESLYGNTRNEDFIMDTFKDLIKKEKYRESVDTVDTPEVKEDIKEVNPIVNFLENKDVGIETIFKKNEIKESLEKLKNYEDIIDEDQVNKELLEYFGFKPEGRATDFGGSDFIGMIGVSKNNVWGVSIIGGELDYNNKEIIDQNSIEKIYNSLYNGKKPVIITNCGLDIHSEGFYSDKLKVIKVPSALN